MRSMGNNLQMSSNNIGIMMNLIVFELNDKGVIQIKDKSH